MQSSLPGSVPDALWANQLFDALTGLTVRNLQDVLMQEDPSTPVLETRWALSLKQQDAIVVIGQRTHALAAALHQAERLAANAQPIRQLELAQLLNVFATRLNTMARALGARHASETAEPAQASTLADALESAVQCAVELGNYGIARALTALKEAQSTQDDAAKTHAEQALSRLVQGLQEKREGTARAA